MRLSTIALLACLAASPVASAPCGGDFSNFLRAMSAEAAAKCLPRGAIDAFMAGRKQPKSPPQGAEATGLAARQASRAIVESRMEHSG